MKIWCVDYSCLSWHVSSKVFYSQEEAIEFANSLQDDDCHRKIYQVDDIWGWCGRNFDKVIVDIIESRDTGDYICVRGIVAEIAEAAEHCGIKFSSAKMDFVADHEDWDDYVLSVAWFVDDELHHMLYTLEGVNCPSRCHSVVERRNVYEQN